MGVLIHTLNFFLFLQAAKAYNLFCYYESWAQYRTGTGRFVPSDIPADLCTHVIFAFSQLTTTDKILSTFEYNDVQMYQEMMNLKSRNSNLKVLLAVGGWTHRGERFSSLVADESLRSNFVTTSIAYLRRYGFDGLDLDWEFPAKTDRGGRAQDKTYFTTLCKELQEGFQAEATRTGSSKLILTAAVSAGKAVIDEGYEVSSLSRYLDFINIMTYDFHGAFERVTGHNSPLYADDTKSTDYAARYWASKGADKKKLIIGMPTYGRSFTLSTSRTGLGAPASGGGPAGTYTRTAGFLAYYEASDQCDVTLVHGLSTRGHEDSIVKISNPALVVQCVELTMLCVVQICKKIEEGQGTRHLLTTEKVPYYVNGNEWIGYDDVESITTKINYVIDNGYGGAMVWAVGMDDFRQTCRSSQQPYPLINTMKRLLSGAGSSQTGGATTNGNVVTTRMTTRKSQEASTEATTTEGNQSSSDFSCTGRDDGIYADPQDCSRYYVCNWGSAQAVTCDTGLLFNPVIQACDWEANVTC